jgi:carboxyl-terminal processing protease
MRTAARVLGICVLVAATLAAGMYLGGHPGDLPDPLQDVFVEDNTAVSADAADVIKDNFKRDVPDLQLQNGSLRGMVESLNDRFSHYFSPRENRLFREAVGGQFSGVGMTVIEHRRGLQVTGVYDDTPAKSSGIRPGPVITHVNGKSIAGQSSQLATARIKGKEGTFVTLTVRNPRGGRRTVRIKRERIEVPVVAGRVERRGGRKLGVISIASFTSGVHGQLRREAMKLLARDVDGFVIDLRQNGGGLLDEAVLVASAFVPEGVIVSTRGRTRPERELRATGTPITRKKSVVLVDRGTASASEIVTAAMQEKLDSKVVGRRTFGKGVFGQIFDLPNGGALDLTLGNYYTPSGRNLGGKGIEPDVRAVDDPATPRDEALDRALEVLRAELPARAANG